MHLTLFFLVPLWMLFAQLSQPQYGYQFHTDLDLLISGVTNDFPKSVPRTFQFLLEGNRWTFPDGQ